MAVHSFDCSARNLKRRQAHGMRIGVYGRSRIRCCNVILDWQRRQRVMRFDMALGDLVREGSRRSDLDKWAMVQTVHLNSEWAVASTRQPHRCRTGLASKIRFGYTRAHELLSSTTECSRLHCVHRICCLSCASSVVVRQWPLQQLLRQI